LLDVSVALQIIWPNFLLAIWRIGATLCPTGHKAFGRRFDPSINSFVTSSSRLNFTIRKPDAAGSGGSLCNVSSPRRFNTLFTKASCSALPSSKKNSPFSSASSSTVPAYFFPSAVGGLWAMWRSRPPQRRLTSMFGSCEIFSIYSKNRSRLTHITLELTKRGQALISEVYLSARQLIVLELGAVTSLC